MKILVVDDEEMAHQLVTAVVRVMEDVTVESAYGAQEALSLARKSPPDLIVSDINMPEMDGLMLVRELRQDPALSSLPILLLTARGEVQDKYEGFLQGADDYLVKPFDVIELQLRIKALLRRAAQRGETKVLAAVLGVGPLCLTHSRYAAQLGDQEVRFTASEYAILRYLAEHHEQLVSAETLLQHALGYPPKVGNSQTVHSHMRNLRGKFRKSGIEPTFITSSWQGYTLEFVTEGR